MRCAATARLSAPRKNDPHVGAGIPRTAAIVAEPPVDREAGARQLLRHLLHGKGAKHQVERVPARASAAALDVRLSKRGEVPCWILAHRFDERELRAARPAC